MEEWRPVVGYEGVYDVSNQGRIKRLPFLKWCGTAHVPVDEKVLIQTMRADGYNVVTLCKNGKGRVKSVHSIVASAFLGVRPHKACTDHINRVKTDNRVVNLRYVSYSENRRNVDRVNNSSKFNGVTWKKSHNKWCAQISLNGSMKHVGMFLVEADAAKAYDDAIDLYGLSYQKNILTNVNS